MSGQVKEGERASRLYFSGVVFREQRVGAASGLSDPILCSAVRSI